MLGMITTDDPGTTGIRDIAEAIGGGIKENSLFLIEGEARTGKSVLSQHIAYGVLYSKGSAIAYYSTDYNNHSLGNQMESMSMENIKAEIAADHFRVYFMGSQNMIANAEKALKLITDHIRALPKQFQLVVVDSPSPLMQKLDAKPKLDFLQECKELCEQNGRSIIITIDSHALESRTIQRAYAMSDYYLKLTSQNAVLASGQVDTRVIKMMDVTKLAGADRIGEKPLKFEIKPNVGMQILPLMQVRI
jgi:archaellum biogenesis ATPase FlaH